MKNLNIKVVIFGVIIQALTLGLVLFTKDTIAWCSEKSHTHPNGTSEKSHADEKSREIIMNRNNVDLQKSINIFDFNKSSPASESTSHNPDKNNNAITYWLSYLLAAGGFMVLAGLLAMIFRKNKSARTEPEKPFHLCSIQPVLTPMLYQLCLRCGLSVKNTTRKTRRAEDSGIWVIEITLSSSVIRKKTFEAIKGMQLPLARMESNFIITGPYRSKSEAAEVVSRLYEDYNVRGWLMPGN